MTTAAAARGCTRLFGTANTTLLRACARALRHAAPRGISGRLHIFGQFWLNTQGARHWRGPRQRPSKGLACQGRAWCQQAMRASFARTCRNSLVPVPASDMADLNFALSQQKTKLRRREHLRCRVRANTCTEKQWTRWRTLSCSVAVRLSSSEDHMWLSVTSRKTRDAKLDCLLILFLLMLFVTSAPAFNQV